MNNKSNAKLEVRFENSKSLVMALSAYQKYNPSSEDIKPGTYSQFITEVENQLTPYKTANGAVMNAMKDNKAIFSRLSAVARKIRSEIGEVKSRKSPEYVQVNSIVKLITGQNIIAHSRIVGIKRSKMRGENEPEPEFNSVSQLDFNSRLGNLKTLIGLLRNYNFYNPADESISIAALEQLERALADSLRTVMDKGTEYTTERSKIINIFNGESGLSDRARRAKMNVLRNYGKDSPEYKAIVRKEY